MSEAHRERNILARHAPDAVTTLNTWGILLGGVGLFLLGMNLLTSGLRTAAGPALENLLAQSTRTRWRGLMAGAVVTALVQSSSAVTVAAIGFVNAGLLTFSQSLWVLFGANVGTTMTGWLVAVLGFKIKIEVAALPMIGAGMALNLSDPDGRRGGSGLALAGFGLLFLGIGFLQQSFAHLGQQVDLGAYADASPGAIAAMVLAGMLLTALMQSSSAALAAVLTLAESGLLPTPGAAAAAIGSNIGTSITALLATIGATANARRAAAAHVAFNLVTAAVALLLLPLLLLFTRWLVDTLELQSSPAVLLALFHTVFNVLGVLLMWPLAEHLGRFLQRRFTARPEILAVPRFLGRDVAQIPALAVAGLEKELLRLAGELLPLVRARVTVGLAPGMVNGGERALTRLADALANFVTEVNRQSMTEETLPRLANLLTVLRHYRAVLETLPALHQQRAVLGLLADSAVAGPTRELADQAAALIDLAQPGAGHATECEQALEAFFSAYEHWKASIFRATAHGEIPARVMEDTLQYMRLVRRLVDRCRWPARSSMIRAAAERAANAARRSEHETL
ncbi:MAG: Na/Pi cotransporter family protein [Gammaproteobacteria bacterium]|nr:Na/Pi cotransporter family protein [Gammaproteobacteria bacterium]